MTLQYFLGIDVGTQGVRCIVSDGEGNIAAESSRDLAGAEVHGLPDRHHEQVPAAWWEAVVRCIRELTAKLAAEGRNPRDITAICVDSTSGTVLPVGPNGRPLRNAVMYNDGRASEEAEFINDVAKEHCARHGYKFSPSFALAKILWLKRNEPGIFERIHKFVHATDFIIGGITGSFEFTDISSALKTGCDLVDCRWPDFIETKLGIPLDKLPQPVMPGTAVGKVSEGCASETGLHRGTKVLAGMTDGTAAFLSSGAAQAGDFNTTLGTTLVIKGLWREIVKDPKGRIYSHRHPSGGWLPGGASNVGGECLEVRFKGRDLRTLDAAAMGCFPTKLVVYPLVRDGERMPFPNAEARGFVVGEAASEEELYAAHLEGIACTERMCYDLMTALGAEVGNTVFTTGGGAGSREWMQIRADILGRAVCRPATAESAYGCCVLAACKSAGEDLSAATRRMVRVDLTVEPRPGIRAACDRKYERFREECAKRGYVL